MVRKEEKRRRIATFRDITGRKRAEDELLAERNKLQAIIDAMEYGLTIQDRDYNIIYQNKVLEKLFGRLGEKCYRVYEGKDKICDGCPIEMALKDGQPHTSERKVVMPRSGEIAFWENTANPIRDADGKIVSCLEITRDITGRKRAEEERATAAASKISADTIKGMIDVVGISDMGGRITQINEAVEVWGYKKEELIGKPVVEILAKRSLPKLEEERRKTLETGVMKNLELVGLEKDGSEFPVLVNVSLMKDAEDKPTGRIFSLRDITEIKHAQEKEKELTAIAAAADAEKKKAEELRALNQQLRASEQQLKAANQQLRASEQQLKAANQQLRAKEEALRESQEVLRKKMADLERFNRLMVGRELEMVKLKEEVNSLLEKSGQPKKYEAPEKIKKVEEK